jgi:hypothetical protein
MAEGARPAPFRAGYQSFNCARAQDPGSGGRGAPSGPCAEVVPGPFTRARLREPGHDIAIAS